MYLDIYSIDYSYNIFIHINMGKITDLLLQHYWRDESASGPQTRRDGWKFQ